MQSSHQREIPTLVNALSLTSPPSMNKAISSTRTFTANMKAKNDNSSLPTVPSLPRNQYGLEDVEDFFNAADRTLTKTQPSSTHEPSGKGITIQGVNFSYWQPDVASDCSESSEEEEELASSPVPQKSPITNSSHRTRTPLLWTGAPSQGGILRESTIPPPVGSPVPVESLSPPTDNSPREMTDVEIDHDAFDFVQDYESSISPNSRRASLASIAAAISHARRSSVAPPQSHNRGRRTSTNVAVQTNDDSSRNLHRVSFYSRRSSSRGSARPSTGSSLFGRRAGFVGYGRTADGALLCEANGLTFELLVEQGPRPAIDVGTQFDPEIEEGLNNQAAKQKGKDDRIGDVPISNGAEPVSEGSEDSENAEDTNAKVPDSDGAHTEQRDSTQANTIKSRRLSTGVNAANNRLSAAASRTSRRVSIAPEAVTVKEQNGGSTPRRNSRRSSVLPSMKSSKLQSQDPNHEQIDSPAARKSGSLRRPSSSRLPTKQRGQEEDAENFFRDVEVEIIEPDVVITHPEVERRASTRSSRPTMEIFGYATDDDDDDVGEENIQTEKELLANQPEDEMIHPTAETLQWERVNITAGVDIRPATTPSAKSTRLSRRASKLNRQSVQAVEKDSERASKETENNGRRSTRGRKSIAAVFEEELPEMDADDEVNAADLTLELDTQAMNDPEPERSDNEVVPEPGNQDEEEPSMSAPNNLEIVQLANISYASSLPNTESKTASTLAEKAGKTTNQRVETSSEQRTESQHNTEPDVVLDSAPMMELGDMDDDNDADFGFDEDDTAEAPEDAAPVPTELVDEVEESPEPVARRKRQTKAKAATKGKKSTIAKNKKKATTTTKRGKGTKRTKRKKSDEENFEPKKRVRVSNESELVHQAHQVEEEQETGLRRSKRVRFGRLKYWKNERPIYERRRSQEMPTIAEVEIEENHDPDDKDVQWYTGRR